MSLLRRGVIEKFSLLLPSLEVEAVSQASSPKSNPNLSLSVRTFLVKGTTNKVDRSVTSAERRKTDEVDRSARL